MGLGVLMTARDLDTVHDVYRIWSTKTVTLDPVDSDGVIPTVVQLVTGTRPTLRSSLKDVTLADIRTTLGPREAANAAVGTMTILRDKRAKAYETELEKRRAEAAAKVASDLFDGLPAQHERDTPLSRLSGFGDAKRWGLEVAADLAAYWQGELAWADCDRGVLLSGPPGVGKTRFARALAAEAGVPFFPSSFSKLIGGSGTGYTVEKELKKFWAEAKKAALCVVFFDEMDSVPGRDLNPDHNSSYFNSVNNAFLDILDGAEPRDGVVVVAATNYPERIDPALKRPGRLNRHIAIPMPGIDDLAGIVAHHLGTDTTDMQGQLQLAARACRGMTPADVEQACRDARRRARKLFGRGALPGDVVMALVERRGDVDPRIERLTAVHEAGHAVAGLLLGLKLGHVDIDRSQTSIQSRAAPTTAMVEVEITMVLAGRAAETVLIGEVTSGSKIDLAQATKAAMAYHVECGFVETFGLLSLGASRLNQWGPLHEAVRGLVDRAYDRALALVGRHRDSVERVAAALVRDRYLEVAEVAALVRSPLLALVRDREDGPEPVPGRAPSAPRRGHGWVPRLVLAA